MNVCIVFLLPPESGEKISLAITVFLALSLNMLVISEYIPANSLQTPIASKYCLFSMFLVCLSLWLSVLVLNLQGSESASYLYSSKPNKRVRRLARAIGPWLLVGGSPNQEKSPKKGAIPLKPVHNNSNSNSNTNHCGGYVHTQQGPPTPVCIPNHVTFEKIENHVMSNNNHVTVTTNQNSTPSIYRNPHTCNNRITANNKMTGIQRHTIYYSMAESLDQNSTGNQSTQSINKQSTVGQATLENILEVFLEKLEAIQLAQDDKKDVTAETKSMLEEWGYLARVVDRFFAAVYFIVNVMCLLPFIPYYAGWI